MFVIILYRQPPSDFPIFYEKRKVLRGRRKDVRELSQILKNLFQASLDLHELRDNHKVLKYPSPAVLQILYNESRYSSAQTGSVQQQKGSFYEKGKISNIFIHCCIIHLCDALYAPAYCIRTG